MGKNVRKLNKGSRKNNSTNLIKQKIKKIKIKMEENQNTYHRFQERIATKL